METPRLLTVPAFIMLILTHSSAGLTSMTSVGPTLGTQTSNAVGGSSEKSWVKFPRRAFNVLGRQLIIISHLKLLKF
jgi:hypothetical protein